MEGAGRGLREIVPSSLIRDCAADYPCGGQELKTRACTDRFTAPVTHLAASVAVRGGPRPLHIDPNAVCSARGSYVLAVCLCIATANSLAALVKANGTRSRTFASHC